MTLTIPEAQPHTKAFVAVIDAAGISVASGTGSKLTGKYAVVYADLGDLDGPIGDRFADLEQTVFVHSVGVGPDQAQWVADKSRIAILTGIFAIPDRKVLFVSHESSQLVARDDDVQPSLFYAVDEYLLATTPA